jgi:hypothetical protein
MTHGCFYDVTESSITLGGKRGYTVPLSISVHAAILAALIVIPLMAVDALPVPPTTLVHCRRACRPRRAVRRVQSRTRIPSSPAPVWVPRL